MPEAASSHTETTKPDTGVAIIGAGFSGIGTAIALDEAGFRDFLVLDAADDYGGVWHWNTYPGVAVDIPSFSYQFSYEQRPDWSRSYAPGRELKAYAIHCADKYGLRGRTRFGTLIECREFFAHCRSAHDRSRQPLRSGGRDHHRQPPRSTRRVIRKRHPSPNRNRWRIAADSTRWHPRSRPAQRAPTRQIRRPRASHSQSSPLKITTWNVNSLTARLGRAEAWLRANQSDVLCLQELKLETHKFPHDMFAALGYRAAVYGQKTYNGVAIIAKNTLPEFADVQMGVPGFEDEQCRAIAATIGDVRVIDLYVVNGQAVDSDKFQYKLRWLDAVHGWLHEEITRHPRLVVLGDFNIAPDDRDVHDPQLWNDESILTSTAERAALRRLLALGLHDSFRLLHDDGGQFSWWDYRQAAFRRNLGLRIDLLLVSEAMRAGCKQAWIDRTPRGWERASDHTPVLVELDCD